MLFVFCSIIIAWLATYSGWATKPTPTSEIARLSSNVFKVFDNDEVFLSACIVMMFNTMAVKDKIALMTQLTTRNVYKPLAIAICFVWNFWRALKMFSFLSKADTVNYSSLWTFPKRFQCSIVLPSMAVGLKWAVDFSASIVKKSLSRAHNIWNLTSKGFRIWIWRPDHSEIWIHFPFSRNAIGRACNCRSSSVKCKKVIWNYWRDIKVETAAGLQWIVNTQLNRN